MLGIVQLTTSDERGCLRSRPLAVQRAGCDGVIWFFVARSSEIASAVECDPRVNASCMDVGDGAYLSFSGTARLVRDKEIARDLWSATSETWFPGGIDDPELTLLKVMVDHAETWCRDSNRMVRFFSVATPALLSSKPPAADARAVLQM